MGVWTNPRARRQGYALGMLREVCGHLARKGKTITLFVMPLAERGRGPLGRVRVSVSDGLSVVSGDTAFTVSVERATEHRLEIRCLRPGTHHVTGTLVIDSSDGFQDYFELDLPISVTGDTLSPGRPDILRAESMIGGRRLRYAGGWLVPMDEGDRFDNREFVRRGTRARAVGAEEDSCKNCPRAGGVDTVAFVVVVDKGGRVMQASALGLVGRPRPSAATVDAANKVLAGWRFEPARLGGEPVNDWTYVRVPVAKSP